MTDNNSNTQATAQQKSATTDKKPDNQELKPVIQTPGTNSVPSAAKGADSSKKTVKPAEAPMKMVNIFIADSSYNIFCPVHEEQELRSAVHYINNFATDIKKDAPKLSQEDLLVLTCLNLYEKIQDNNKAEISRQQQNDQNEAFLNKIIKDAQSIL